MWRGVRWANAVPHHLDSLLAKLREMGMAVETGEGEGIRAAAGSTTPDWLGGAPSIDYSGEPNDTAVRDSVVHKPSEDATTGIAIIEDRYAGSTAADYDLSAPCFAPEGFGG